MRLFVSEFICGGGWIGDERPASLVREGAAMLRAIVGDLLRIPEMRVVTTWDRSLAVECGMEPHQRFEVISVAGADEEREVFDRLCREVDATYVIAPELDDELSRRVTVACGSARTCSVGEPLATVTSYNCSVAAIDLCGDKWAMYEHLSRCGIPTLPTFRVGTGDEHLLSSWPRVLKLRRGAGSQSMQLVTTPGEWPMATSRYDHMNRSTEAIAQPFIPGVALSVAAIVDRAGAVQLLPVADQFIEPQKGFAYLGGRIPSASWAGSVDALLRETLASIPGLFGYVGVDLLIPEGSRDQLPLIVEINPRLTTSYVGYQKLCRDNLAALWIGDAAARAIPRWQAGHVEFNSAGECS